MMRTVSHYDYGDPIASGLRTASEGWEGGWMVSYLVDNHDGGRLCIMYLGADTAKLPDAVLFGRSVRSRIYGVL